MSSSTSDMESQTSPGGSLLSAVSRKWKLVLSLVLLLGAVAAIGVCAAVVVVSTGSGSSGQGKQDSTRSVEGLEIEGGEMDLVENEVIRSRRFPARAQVSDTRSSDSCYSDALNDSLPAAHIKGKGAQWQSEDGRYVPEWNCNGSMAFVSGGMWFQQKEKSLYVPKCGWYYVSSQIVFQSKSPQSVSYHHTLKVDRNCDSAENLNMYLSGYTSAGPATTSDGYMSHQRTSTFVGDIVKICRGGRIYVDIPVEGNACCPRGYESMTSLTAHLVRESDCQWPVPSYKEPRETFQRSN